MKPIANSIKYILLLIPALLTIAGCATMHYGGQDVTLAVNVTDAKGISVPAAIYVVDNMVWSTNRNLNDEGQKRQRLDELLAKEKGALAPIIQKDQAPATFTLQPYATVIFADWNGKLTEYRSVVTPGRIIYDSATGQNKALSSITIRLRE